MEFASKEYRVRQVLRDSKARYATNIFVGDVIQYTAEVTHYNVVYHLKVNDEVRAKLQRHEIFRMFKDGNQSIFDVEEI